MNQIGENEDRVFYAADPQSYELPQETLKPANKENGRSRNSSHHSSHSTRRLRYTLGPDGRRMENWFNDSFEDEANYSDLEDRYATHPSLGAGADIAKSRQSTNSKSGSVAVEENLYDFPEEIIASHSESGGGDIYDDTVAVNQEEAIYECPDDIITESPVGDAYKFSGDAAIEIPEEIYECLDEINVDIYEMPDQGSGQTNEATPVDIYQ